MFVWGILALGTVPWRSLTGPARAWSRVLGLVLGFALAALPYVLFLHAHTGQWSVSTKSQRTLVYSRERAQGGEALQARGCPRMIACSTGWGRKRRRGRWAPGWQERGGGGTGAAGDPQARRPLLAACVGLVWLWRRRTPERVWPCWGWRVCWCSCWSFHIEARFLLAPVVLFILLGVHSLNGDVAARRRRRVAIGWRCWSPARSRQMAGSTALLLRTAPLGLEAHSMTPSEATAMLRPLLREEGAPGPIVGNRMLARQLAFWTGRDFLRLPWEARPRTLHFARLHGASFLLLSSGDYPELADLARRPQRTADLTPVARLEVGTGEGKAVFELYRMGGEESKSRGGERP